MVLVTTGIGASTWEGNCTTCLREPACAASPQEPLPLCPRTTASSLLRLTLRPAPRHPSAPWPPYGGTPYSGNSRARDGHGETATGRVSRSTRRQRTHHTVAPGLRESRPTL